MPDDYVALTTIRRSLKGYAKLFKAVEHAFEHGWKARAQGHGYRLYCPCGPGGSQVRVSHTPKDQDREAAHIRRQIAHCPTKHGLIR